MAESVHEDRHAPGPATRGPTRVYVRAGVISMLPDDAHAPEDPVPVPGLADALGHLADGNHELVIVEDPGRPLPALDGLPVPVRTEAVDPPGLAEGSWLITDDPEGCSRVARGVRTILVGPRRAPTHRPIARCDLEARDLAAAVIEILAREAMS